MGRVLLTLGGDGGSIIEFGSDDGFDESATVPQRGGGRPYGGVGGKAVKVAGEVSREAVRALEDVADDVAKTINAFAHRVNDHVDNAEEIVIEFGFSIGAEGNLNVVKANAGAELKVTLKWLEKNRKTK